MEFPLSDSKKHYTIEDNQIVEYPLFGANMITVKDILTLANIEYEEMRFYGGTIIVKLHW
jgi:hypothetical protein